MNKKFNILLIEDDGSLGYLLTEYLKMKGFNIVWEKSPLQGLKKITSGSYDLVILDVMMPEMDGFTLANEINKVSPNQAFIFLTARSLKIDVLKGFSLGAVDYLKKPIDEEELVVRINTLLSRLNVSLSQVNKEANIAIGDYHLKSSTQELFYGEEVIHLTSRENELLVLLASHKNELCSHKEILNSIWGDNDYFNRKSLNVFVTHLRKYLEKDTKIKIENIHSKGFVLRDNKVK